MVLQVGCVVCGLMLWWGWYNTKSMCFLGFLDLGCFGVLRVLVFSFGYLVLMLLNLDAVVGVVGLCLWVLVCYSGLTFGFCAYVLCLCLCMLGFGLLALIVCWFCRFWFSTCLLLI